jgi:hypothetical protein
MNTENKIKGNYCTPRIECVKLDNEISLALQSLPPTFELVKDSSTPEYFNNDPFKSNIS